jgi:hypothetical protein
MAQLDSATKDELTQAFLRALSRVSEPIPVSHQAVRAVVDTCDAELEAAETAILAALSPNARTWLTSNPRLARQIVVAIEAKRKEVL